MSEIKQEIKVLDATHVTASSSGIGTFYLPAHTGAVDILVLAYSKGDPYARYGSVTINGEQVDKRVIATSYKYEASKELNTGENTITVAITSYVGYWEVYITVFYEPAIIPPILPPIESIDILIPVVGTISIIIVGIGAYLITDGFKRIPTFELPKIPKFVLPF